MAKSSLSINYYFNIWAVILVIDYLGFESCDTMYEWHCGRVAWNKLMHALHGNGNYFILGSLDSVPLYQDTKLGDYTVSSFSVPLNRDDMYGN